MKTIYPGTLLVALLVMTSCPRPILPDFCDKPSRIFVDPICYNPINGLTISASTIESLDTSIQLKWMVYILADSSQQAPFKNPLVNNVAGGYSLALPDSLLEMNQKIYVEVRSTCAGVPDVKTTAINGNVFVKRYSKISNCYQWTERND